MQHSINGNNYVKSILNYVKILFSQCDYLQSNIISLQKNIGDTDFLTETTKSLKDINQKLHFIENKILNFDKDKMSKLLLESNIISELNEIEITLNNRLNTKINRLIQSYLTSDNSKNDNINRYHKN
jgi:hypothetical protein